MSPLNNIPELIRSELMLQERSGNVNVKYFYMVHVFPL